MLKLDGAPIDRPVRIRWDTHQIPFIAAQSDTDLAAALGVVHAHLRLGQIDLMRRLSQGRLAEIAGPLAIEADRTIRLIDLGCAVPGIIAALPPATLAWAEAFLRGLNHVVASAPLPYEHRLLGIRPEPWTLADFFTLARLVSADLTWLVGARLLRAQRRAGAAWPSIWPKLLAGGAPTLMDLAGEPTGNLLARPLRAGSNAAAVAASRSAKGAAMIASDPHLGLALPCNWLIAGLRSPGIHAVGLMIPGMPFIALGRNAHIAWGGTSLHAASSDIIDVTGLPLTEHAVSIKVRGARDATLRLRHSAYGPIVSDGLLLKDDRPLALPCNWLIAGLRSPGIHAVGLMIPGMPFIALGRNAHIAWGGTSLHAASSDIIDVTGLPLTEHAVSIKVRGARDATLRLRHSAYGPIVSDGLLLKDDRPLALRWVGHAPSDELTAMLGVLGAASLEAFNAALNGFAVPGQMMVCAAADGRIGKRAAVHMPDRPRPDGIVTKPENAWDFADIQTGQAMPVWIDPPDGILVSANEKPDRGTIPLGFFFSPPDRADRLRALLAHGAKPDEAALRSLQQDTLHPAALAIRDEWLPFLATAPADFTSALRAWDGRYDPDATGALAYELLIGHLLTAVFPKQQAAPYAAVWGTRRLLLAELRALPPPRIQAAIAAAARQAAPLWRRYRVWGAVHRYRPAHYFGALPVLGRRFRAAAFPAPGGDDTLHKTGHGLVRKPHDVGFGAGARHISDLADLDSNRFVLLGGQDGWFGSNTARDQVELWRRGEYITVPMRPESVAAAFQRETILMPGSRSALSAP